MLRTNMRSHIVQTSNDFVHSTSLLNTVVNFMLFVYLF